MGINVSTRFGVRVRTANCTSLAFCPLQDKVPDNNMIQYIRASARVNTATTAGFVSPASSNLRFNFATSAANGAVSSGDKGLLLFYGDNPADSETSVLQIVN